MEYFFELFLGGLTRGSIYALIALGYTMVYGIIELINFAHGEIYMIGAFTALIVASVLTVMGLNQLRFWFWPRLRQQCMPPLTGIPLKKSPISPFAMPRVYRP